MSQIHVVSDPDIMLGKPTIAGTRITVELILEKLAAGEPAEQIYTSYPQLPPGAVEAALSSNRLTSTAGCSSNA